MAYSEIIEPPKIISSAIETYRHEGAGAALDELLFGSPLANEEALKSNVVSTFHTIEVSYGSIVGCELIGSVSFSKSVKRYYVALLYAKGPLFSWFEVYNIGGKEIITSFDINTKADKELPACFFQRDETPISNNSGVLKN